MVWHYLGAFTESAEFETNKVHDFKMTLQTKLIQNSKSAAPKGKKKETIKLAEPAFSFPAQKKTQSQRVASGTREIRFRWKYTNEEHALNAFINFATDSGYDVVPMLNQKKEDAERKLEAAQAELNMYDSDEDMVDMVENRLITRR